jgi:hypothetical protein
MNILIDLHIVRLTEFIFDELNVLGFSLYTRLHFESVTLQTGLAGPIISVCV